MQFNAPGCNGVCTQWQPAGLPNWSTCAVFALYVGLRRTKYDTGLLSIIFIYRPVKSHRYGLVVPAQNRICQIQQAVAVLRGRRYVSAENRTVYTVYTAITCGLCLSSLFPEITPDSAESSDGLTEEPLGIAGTIPVSELAVSMRWSQTTFRFWMLCTVFYKTVYPPTPI